MSDRPALLTAEQVADRIGVSPQSVYRWAQQKKLGVVRIGGVVRFHPEDVEAFIERSTREAEGVA